ncbi:Sec-independent protein translocase subunit TatA [Cumulibacter soli]|uniref:Sec-independent protein translocase subunit TatA n=1 Tax=Cumulibacter soli TaxID=2546344 RepID=UPI001068A22C|nr:Sec-independent protein translocase subunit TatA [Cumulibacter soli]
MNLGPMEIVIIAIVIFALFGYKKLPDATRAVGRSLRIFKGEMKGMKDEDVATKAEAQTVRAPLETPQPQTPVVTPPAESTKQPHTPPSTTA